MDWISEIFGFLLELLYRYWFEIFVCTTAALFAFFSIRTLCAAFSRFLFVSKLKSLAKKKTMIFRVWRSPLCSLLFGTFRLDITLQKSEETFSIFFCPRNVRKRNIYIFDDTKIYCTKIRGFSFLENRNWGGDPSLVTTIETKKRAIKLQSPPINPGHNVLVFEPNPISLFVRRGNGYVKSGSGDTIGSFLLYESKDFITYINRNY